MKLMSKIVVFYLTAISSFGLQTGMASADVETSLIEAFKQGEVKGQLKTYYFAQLRWRSPGGQPDLGEWWQSWI